MPYTQIAARVQGRAATVRVVVAMIPVSRRALMTRALLLSGVPALSAMRSSRVEALIARMTIAEEAGQLSCFSDTVRPLGRAINPAEAARSADAKLADVRAGQVKMLFNGHGVGQLPCFPETCSQTSFSQKQLDGIDELIAVRGTVQRL